MTISRIACTSALVLLAAPAQAQTARAPLRATSETLYTLRLPASATDRLPAHAHAITLDARGRLFVLDRSTGGVWMFGPGGALERRMDLGETGRNALDMVATRDGRLVLSDASRRALVVVDPARPAGARTHALGEFVPSGALVPHPAGGVVMQARTLPSLATGAWDRDVHFRWYPLDGRPVVTLRSVAPAQGARGGAPGVSSMPLLALAGDAVALAADPRRYHIELTGGRRSRVLERSESARTLTADDRDWLAARSACSPPRMVGASGSAPVDPSLLAGSRPPRAQRHPERVSAVARMAGRPSGELWVERAGPRLDRPGAVDVYRADGTFLGSAPGLGVPDAWTPDGRTAAYVTRGLDCRSTVVVRRVDIAAR